jgi:hypothetical protein
VRMFTFPISDQSRLERYLVISAAIPEGGGLVRAEWLRACDSKGTLQVFKSMSIGQPVWSPRA